MKCFNCKSDNVEMLEEHTSGCDDAPKGKTIIKLLYWCYNCKGIYIFKFKSMRDLEID